MLFLDPSERVVVEVRGVKWTIQPVPIGKLEQLELEWNETRAGIDTAAEGTPAHAAALARWLVRCAPVNREIIRWGVVGWDRPKPLPEFVDDQFAGASFKVLAPRLAEFFGRVDHGLLALDLARAVFEENRLTKEQFLGFE